MADEIQPQSQEASAPAPAGPASASFGGGERSGGGGGRGGFGGGRGRGGPGGGRGRGRPRSGGDDKPAGDTVEKVVFINRSAKVVKGGRRFSFSALVVVGDKKGRVGIGLGKAAEVAEAIRKGGEGARSAMVSVSLQGVTLPHEIYYEFGGAKIMLRPASPGTGIIAGKTVRSVLEAAGLKDVLSKSLGSSNAANVVKATLGALQQLRVREDIYKSRGLTLRPKKEAAVGTTAVTAVTA